MKLLSMRQRELQDRGNTKRRIQPPSRRQTKQQQENASPTQQDDHELTSDSEEIDSIKLTLDKFVQAKVYHGMKKITQMI
jgi:hypothetical protein